MKHLNFFQIFFVLIVLSVSSAAVSARQTAEPRRTSGVKVAQPPARDSESPSNKKSSARSEAEKRENEKKRAADQKRENEKKLREEFRRREQELKNQAAAEREKLAREKQARETERNNRKAEEERKKEDDERLRRRQAEEEKNRLDEQRAAQKRENEANRLKAKTAEAERKRLEAENKLAEEKRRADEIERKRLEAIAEKERLDREKKELAEREKTAEAEKNRLEKERLETEKREAELREKNILRLRYIEDAARKYRFVRTDDAARFVPAGYFSAVEIETVLRDAARQNPQLVTPPNFCDPDFRGEPLNVMLSANPTLGGFLSELADLFDVNFLPDPEILDLPVAGDVKNVPWNFVLRSQLNFLDLEARCTEGSNTVAILKRSKLQTIQDNQRKTAPLRTEFIKLKYLQPVVGGQVNVAGRGTNGSNVLESLEAAINKILRADGDNRGSISRIPGKNEFIITATSDQIGQIKRVIERADRPSYQVIVYASVVTANENKLKDIGGQVSAIGGTANFDLLGGLTGFGGSQNSTGGATGSTPGGSTANNYPPGSLVPGGVRTLGPNFGSAPTGGSTLGVSGIFGTFQLAAQLNLLQQQGVVKIDNRPHIIVLDGQTADLQIGRQVSVPIQSVNNFGNGAGGQLEVLNAGNTLNVSPQVIEDENGKPVAVNLNLRVESNDVDTTVVSQGVPSVIRRATQTALMINTSQTAVIGGFSTDSETKSDSKTPVLGDIPVVGNAFKRKVRSQNADRLYFAIRVEVVSQGDILTTVPMNIETAPKLPPPGDFFKPYNESPVKNNP